jgi:hypothetical protein
MGTLHFYYRISLLTEEKQSLSATRNRGIFLSLYYKTLSATRKFSVGDLVL